MDVKFQTSRTESVSSALDSCRSELQVLASFVLLLNDSTRALFRACLCCTKLSLSCAGGASEEDGAAGDVREDATTAR